MTGLRKSLGFWDSVALVIGGIVGTGIFRTPAEVGRYLQDPGWVLFAWALGGVIAFLGSLCFGELAALFPESGGNYVYLKYAFGSWAGFLFGWAELSLMSAASIASVSYAFGEYFTNLLPAFPGGEKLIAIALIWILTLVNVAGLHYGKWLQNVLTSGKGIALISLILLGIFMGRGDLAHFQTQLPALPQGMSLAHLGLALIPIMWTYGGWHESTFVAGEYKETDRDLPLSILLATTLVILFYLLVNGVYIYLFPANTLAGRNLIAADVMNSIFGPLGKTLITAVILVCIFGVLNTVILVRGRIPYALAQDHAIFKGLGTTHPRFLTPARSLTANAVWASVLVLWGTFGQLLFLSGAAVWFFFAAAAVAVFVARKRFPDRRRPFSAWGYPWTPALFAAVSFWIFLNTALFSPRETLVGFSVIALGVPLYLISKRMALK